MGQIPSIRPRPVWLDMDAFYAEMRRLNPERASDLFLESCQDPIFTVAVRDYAFESNCPAAVKAAAAITYKAYARDLYGQDVEAVPKLQPEIADAVLSDLQRSAKIPQQLIGTQLENLFAQFGSAIGQGAGDKLLASIEARLGANVAAMFVLYQQERYQNSRN